MDTISRERRSENMRRIRSRDTIPELIVRKLVWGLGYRYRLHWKKAPGKPDIAITTQRKAIFIHGCFWHQHDKCRHGRLPKSHLDYWGPKLARNQARDREVHALLFKSGWDVLVIWECEAINAITLEQRLLWFVRSPQHSRTESAKRRRASGSRRLR